MAEIKITGTTRTEFGKGASRRARVAGLVPAVIYGHGEKPQHITLPARELGVALKQSNVLLQIDIDGKDQLTLPKAIVRHPLKQILEHIERCFEAIKRSPSNRYRWQGSTNTSKGDCSPST